MLMPHKEGSLAELANIGLVYLDSGEVDEMKFFCRMCKSPFTKLSSFKHFTGKAHLYPAEEVDH